jgi:hypothetical protein
MLAQLWKGHADAVNRLFRSVDFRREMIAGCIMRAEMYDEIKWRLLEPVGLKVVNNQVVLGD